MSTTIITKYNDYDVQPIEFFISKIENELLYRDLPGITNNRIQKINVTKQHPIATLMAAQISDAPSTDHQRSSIIPAISVTPGNAQEGGFVLGQGPEHGAVDDTFIDLYESYLSEDFRTILQDGLISKAQITTIKNAYVASGAGAIRYIKTRWNKNEDVNISVWADSPDADIILGVVMDSIIAEIQTGFTGDDSPVKNLQYRISKGLTNFNFGRVLFGSEYSLTFTNTYNNYTIYADPVISDHTFNGTFSIPGSS